MQIAPVRQPSRFQSSLKDIEIFLAAVIFCSGHIHILPDGFCKESIVVVSASFPRPKSHWYTTLFGNHSTGLFVLNPNRALNEVLCPILKNGSTQDFEAAFAHGHDEMLNCNGCPRNSPRWPVLHARITGSHLPSEDPQSGMLSCDHTRHEPIRAPLR